MKSVVILCLAILPAVFGNAMFPLPNYQPSACRFYGPQDAATLKGVSFIQNAGSDKCFTTKNYGINNKPIVMESCSWSSLPKSEQLYLFKNNNGGLTLKPSVNSFGVDSCIAPSGGPLSSIKCVPKSSEQTWQFQRVRNGPLGSALYQIIQQSTGKCLSASTRAERSNIVGERCNSRNDLQLWTICTSK